MKIWLIKLAEPLPVDGPNARIMRMGLLAEQLVSAGHEVLYWTGAFDHNTKRHRFAEDTSVRLSDNYRICLISSMGYRKSISLRRLCDHRQVARKFARLAREHTPPDIVVCAMPTPDLAVAATNYGRQRNVPVVLDVRDLWPDVILEHVPRPLRGLMKMATWPMRRLVRAACSGATAICGTTGPYVDWGVAYAGRARTALDRDFPMGYSTRAPDDEAIEAARGFWDGYGLGEEAGDFTACFLGRLGFQFDIETVIRAAEMLRGERRKVRFVLCGSGDRLSKYRRAAAALDNVIFPGWIDSARIWALLRMSSVGLAPYRSFGYFRKNLPNKPMEYFSAALPVVSSLKGLLAGLLADNDCGVTYDNGDAGRLAEILRELRDDPRRLGRMSQNALRLYKDRFVAEKVYGEMAGYVQEIASARRGT